MDTETFPEPFRTLALVESALENHGRAHGFRWIKPRSGKKSHQIFTCDRAGAPRTHIRGHHPVKPSKKCNCPVNAIASFNSLSRSWKININCPDHNHELNVPNHSTVQSTNSRSSMDESHDDEFRIPIAGQQSHLPVQSPSPPPNPLPHPSNDTTSQPIENDSRQSSSFIDEAGLPVARCRPNCIRLVIESPPSSPHPVVQPSQSRLSPPSCDLIESPQLTSEVGVFSFFNSDKSEN